VFLPDGIPRHYNTVYRNIYIESDLPCHIIAGVGTASAAVNILLRMGFFIQQFKRSLNIFFGYLRERFMNRLVSSHKA
jgi:hypothetical protein